MNNKKYPQTVYRTTDLDNTTELQKNVVKDIEIEIKDCLGNTIRKTKEYITMEDKENPIPENVLADNYTSLAASIEIDSKDENE